MKGLLITLIALFILSSCGIQRPYPPEISLINGAGSAYSVYSSQGGQSVTVYDLQEAQLNWNVSNVPGAQGVKVIAAKDSYCKDEIIASVVIYVTDSSLLSAYDGTATANPNANMAALFNTQAGNFKAGRYAICISTVRRERVSSPSYPVYVTLMQDQMSYNYFLKANDVNPYEEVTATDDEVEALVDDVENNI